MTLQQLGGKEAPHPCFFFFGFGSQCYNFFFIYICATCRQDDLESLEKSLLSNDEGPDT